MAEKTLAEQMRHAAKCCEEISNLPVTGQCLRSGADEIDSLTAIIENANSALGLHPESTGDIAQAIGDIRDEGRAHFHTVSRLTAQLTAERERAERALEEIGRAHGLIVMGWFPAANNKDLYDRICERLVTANRALNDQSEPTTPPPTGE